jgi:hypothetical protein
MSVLGPCHGGCGDVIDYINEGDAESTALIDDIVDPFTGRVWAQFYCQGCADRLFPGWEELCG